jgi:hypothetical protein
VYNYLTERGGAVVKRIRAMIVRAARVGKLRGAATL